MAGVEGPVDGDGEALALEGDIPDVEGCGWVWVGPREIFDTAKYELGPINKTSYSHRQNSSNKSPLRMPQTYRPLNFRSRLTQLRNASSEGATSWCNSDSSSEDNASNTATRVRPAWVS